MSTDEEWRRILDVLREHAPATARTIRPPGPAKHVRGFESVVALPFPADLVEWWSLMDGIGEDGSPFCSAMVPFCRDITGVVLCADLRGGDDRGVIMEMAPGDGFGATHWGSVTEILIEIAERLEAYARGVELPYRERHPTVLVACSAVAKATFATLLVAWSRQVVARRSCGSTG